MPEEFPERPEDLGPNDLWDAAATCRPELGALSARLTEAGARPRLSGSGSTLFVAEPIDRDADAAERALDAVAERVGPVAAETGSRLLRTRTGPRTIALEGAPSGAIEGLWWPPSQDRQRGEST